MGRQTCDDGRTRCEVCGKELSNTRTFDPWISLSKLDVDGNATESGGQVFTVDHDYIVVGMDCCGGKALLLWRDMSKQLFKPDTRTT